jgi:hypothetical protein
MDPVTRLVDPAFVSANREGRLASRQEARLGDGAYRSRFERVAGFVGSVGAAVAAAGLVSSTADAIPVALGAAIVVGLAAVVFRPWSDPLGQDVRTGRVERVTGSPVSAARVGVTGRGLRPARYDLTIDGLRFRVPVWLWAAVDEARTVTAYYLPRSMTLVSIEAADEGGLPPVLPQSSRRTPIAAGGSVLGAYLAAVGVTLVARALLAPAVLAPEASLGIVLVAIAAIAFVRGAPPR